MNPLIPLLQYGPATRALNTPQATALCRAMHADRLAELVYNTKEMMK